MAAELNRDTNRPRPTHLRLVDNNFIPSDPLRDAQAKLLQSLNAPTHLPYRPSHFQVDSTQSQSSKRISSSERFRQLNDKLDDLKTKISQRHGIPTVINQHTPESEVIKPSVISFSETITPGVASQDIDDNAKELSNMSAIENVGAPPVDPPRRRWSWPVPWGRTIISPRRRDPNLPPPPRGPGDGGGRKLALGALILTLGASAAYCLGNRPVPIESQVVPTARPVEAPAKPVAPPYTYGIESREFKGPDKLHKELVGNDGFSSLGGMFICDVTPFARRVNPDLVSAIPGEFNHENVAQVNAVKAELSGPRKEFYGYLNDRYQAELRKLNAGNTQITFSRTNNDLVNHFVDGQGYHGPDGQNYGTLGHMYTPLDKNRFFNDQTSDWNRAHPDQPITIIS